MQITIGCLLVRTLLLTNSGATNGDVSHSSKYCRKRVTCFGFLFCDGVEWNGVERPVVVRNG